MARTLCQRPVVRQVRAVVGSVVTIMDFSSGCDDFMEKFDRRHPRYGDQSKLPLEYQQDEDEGEGI